jgi:hypothetical protein
MLGVETNLYFAENDLEHGTSFKGITVAQRNLLIDVNQRFNK